MIRMHFYRAKKAAWYFLLVVVGIIIGAFLFSGVQKRSVLAIHRCGGTCLSSSELLGLLGSIIMKKAPGVLPRIVIETDKTVAIVHPTSRAPVHYVIIPKRDIKSIDDIALDDREYLIDMFAVMQELVRQSGIKDYEVVSNGPGQQSVNYLHFHLIGK